MISAPRSLIRLIIVCISLGLSISSGRTVVELWQRRDIVYVREQELLRLRRENAELEARLQDMKNSAYVEKIARNQLGMIKEGEMIVMLPEHASKSTLQINDIDLVRWRQWWRLFF